MLYALYAAIANSSIGIISYNGFSMLDFYQIAVFKSLIAFIIISLICLINKKNRNQIYELYGKKYQIAFLAFWGIFILYFFETKAFSMSPLALVSFIVYGSGIITIFLGYFLLNEEITLKKIIGVLAIISGAVLIVNKLPDYHNITGIVYAAIGGIGYSIFLVFCRKFKIETNIGFLWWLIGFGTVFLLIPTGITNIKLSLPNAGFLHLVFLAVVPTIGGFYFTSKALNNTEASKVQIIEMSDPFFTTVGAFVFFGQTIGLYELIGGVCILIGVLQIR
ncbi:MAG: EamA family transporter [Rickettsiaceae bacterium]|nr:EamA family transporter [Rickettsiaceae bacterium]MCP5378532.1 EamA family transporter [Rickettsiaceae bacterium]